MRFVTAHKMQTSQFLAFNVIPAVHVPSMKLILFQCFHEPFIIMSFELFVLTRITFHNK